MQEILKTLETPPHLFVPEGQNFPTHEVLTLLPEDSTLLSEEQHGLGPRGDLIEPWWEDAKLNSLKEAGISSLVFNFETDFRSAISTTQKVVRSTHLPSLGALINGYPITVTPDDTVENTLNGLLDIAFGENCRRPPLNVGFSIRTTDPGELNALATIVALANATNTTQLVVPSRGAAILKIIPPASLKYGVEWAGDINHELGFGPPPTVKATKAPRESELTLPPLGYVKPWIGRFEASRAGSAFKAEIIPAFDSSPEKTSDFLWRDFPVMPNTEFIIEDDKIVLYSPPGASNTLRDWWSSTSVFQGRPKLEPDFVWSLMDPAKRQTLIEGQIEYGVREYYSRIDQKDLDWVIELFDEDALYLRANETYAGKPAIGKFYREDRKADIVHELNSVEIKYKNAIVKGSYTVFKNGVKVSEGRFMDEWTFNDALKVTKRETYLAQGAETVK